MTSINWCIAASFTLSKMLMFKSPSPTLLTIKYDTKLRELEVLACCQDRLKGRYIRPPRLGLWNNHSINIIAAPPAISSRTSQPELVRDASKLWLNSSIMAIAATKTIGKIYFAIDELENTRKARNARIAYSVKCAAFRM